MPGVAVGRLVGGAVELVGVERIDPRGRSDGLMAAVDALFKRIGARPREIARVAVSVGPGGFTAVRIAVSAAKMIAEVTGAGCIAVPSASVAAWRTPRGRAFAVALASKVAASGSTAWVTGFDGEGAAMGAGALMDAAAVRAMGVGVLVADRFLPAEFGAGMEVVAPVFDPVALLEASAGMPAVDPAALLPVYPREPEAVTKWRALRGGGVEGIG